MKKWILHIVFILISFAGYGKLVPIPDPVFLTFLKGNFGTVMNGDNLDSNLAAQITSNITCTTTGITNLEGIQYFSNVTKINFANNTIVSIPSLLPMTALETVHLYGNQISAAPDFRGMLNLKTVLMYSNQLTQMPLFGNNPIIEEIIIYKNNISKITSLSGVPSLLKLDVGENQLTELPDLSANVNLDQLICWSNQLTTLPSLTKLTKLTRLNAGKNKLTQFPDLSANTQLSIFAIDNNLLTSIPANFIGSPNLTSVKIYNNYFTFKDLGPYAGILTASNIYTYTPMLSPVGDTLDAYYNESVAVHSNVDNIVANVTYTWYEGTTSIAGTGTTDDAVTISQTSGSGVTKRYVYAQITHPSLTSLTLTTDTFLVRFNPCPAWSDISYKASKTDCGNSGSLDIEVQGFVAPGTTYELTSTSFGTTEYYNVNKMTGLIDTAYNLQINFSTACIANYPLPLEMPVVDCNEAFMTPNNDGDMDTYLFTGKGSLVIYDKYGKEVKRANLPYEWDGYGQRGLVQPGYYIVIINGGKEQIHISVLY
ncbi:leucine-rich repeat domain-containing protein [Cytophaga aurantiaca]|uniref:leucine-rich repeat domain-containing protein n=1 Tax=Cytophaga aurantiaca TaxID=29530 RepID=UPI00037DBC96|nr:leucine-rich repeat domain-containing protein [Cytophaga aurantiaca]